MAFTSRKKSEMRLFCPKCFRFTDHYRHCEYCDAELTVGDEVFITEDGKVYCSQCCGRYELEIPDYDDEDRREDFD